MRTYEQTQTLESICTSQRSEPRWAGCACSKADTSYVTTQDMALFPAFVQPPNDASRAPARSTFSATTEMVAPGGALSSDGDPARESSVEVEREQDEPHDAHDDDADEDEQLLPHFDDVGAGRVRHGTDSYLPAGCDSNLRVSSTRYLSGSSPTIAGSTSCHNAAP